MKHSLVVLTTLAILGAPTAFAAAPATEPAKPAASPAAPAAAPAATPKTADDKALAEANTLVSKGEFDKAFKMLRALAAKGNTNAQMRLGALFSIGAGVKENQVLAFGWYQTAADRGTVHGT